MLLVHAFLPNTTFPSHRFKSILTHPPYLNNPGEFPAITRQPSVHTMRPAPWTHQHVVRRHSVSNLADYQVAMGIAGQEAALEAARRGMLRSKA